MPEWAAPRPPAEDEIETGSAPITGELSENDSPTRQDVSRLALQILLRGSRGDGEACPARVQVPRQHPERVLRTSAGDLPGVQARRGT